ncbi:hypothetical protein E1264_28870 [Actinomadura sp. KC216]|uniref:hypothetical protein n=1 Tax=Actinomadura sp. KC216 TaxID=2530370 RepID=UPI0010478F64|nr:hypothetical protein [Actinomadura sp. KC216]TDB83319.1 hypothetical protein E1264_28870 [Actinomadura sp. KC216]
MKGDKGSGGIGDDEGWRNPYPLPGQDWGDPPEADRQPQMPGVPLSKDAPPAFPAAGGFDARSGRNGLGRYYLLMVAVVVFIVAMAAFQISGLGDDDDDGAGVAASAPSPPSSPEPEPVSTVPPKVKGWRAVSSAKYGLTYDVSKAWRILPTGTLSGFEALKGEKGPVMMSSVAHYRDDVCKDGDTDYNRGGAGFNQYVDGTVSQVAQHAANKWATHAYNVEGAPAPVVTLSAPKTVKVGRAKGVHVRADVVIKARGKCDAPAAVVHVVAVPGVGPGKTTAFVLMSDQGVPDAMPKAELTKVLGSLRPSGPAPTGA